MKRWRSIEVGVLALLLATSSGCGHPTVGSAKRTLVLGAGTAVGGIAGAELGGGEPGAAVVGAVTGAGLTQLALGRNPEDLSEGFNQGYVRGQSDAIKRHYWMRQALERGAVEAGGERVYYSVPGPSETPDGRRLVPHTIQIPVLE